MRIMDDYLDYLDYNGIYTQLDGREDWFLSLTKWLKAASKYLNFSVSSFSGLLTILFKHISLLLPSITTPSLVIMPGFSSNG
jgi:hypothetical protein